MIKTSQILDLTGYLGDRSSLTLESYDACRLLEIFWAAKKILRLLEDVDLTNMCTEADLKASGQGIGVFEAPRGILMHSYLINQGRIERMRLIVATQFNNAYINLLLRDLAGKASGRRQYLKGRRKTYRQMCKDIRSLPELRHSLRLDPDNIALF